MQKTCLLILGPTAVGKTSLAIALAKHYGTQIISCDSRQCYRELNIGVARPTAQELATVPHHFIASHSIHEEVNAAVFEQYAMQKVQDIFGSNDIAVMVGGTGLYADAFCKGIDAIPTIEPEIRQQIVAQYAAQGMPWLEQTLKDKDPLFATKGEMQNPQRMMRALEVWQQTGASIINFQAQKRAARPFKIVKVMLDMDRPLLYERINLRVNQMMEGGQLQEAESLRAYQSLNALKTVGYVELFAHFRGELTLVEAVELLKQKTRNYAKRQITWFKRDISVINLPTSGATAADAMEIVDIVNDQS